MNTPAYTPKENISISALLISLYLLLLPIATSLRGIFKIDTSLINFIALGFILALLMRVVKRRSIKYDKSLQFVYAYFFYTLLSTFWNFDIEICRFLLVYIFTVLTFTLILSKQSNSSELKLYKHAIFISGIIAVAAGIYNLENPEYTGGRLWMKLFEVAMDPNDFGCGLCLVSAYCLTEIFTNRGCKEFVLLAFVAFIIMQTGSRGAIVVLLFQLLLCILLFHKNYFKCLCIAVGLSLLFVGVSAQSSDYLAHRLMVYKSLKEDNGAGRFDIWRAAALKFINSGPLRAVCGYGLVSFSKVANENKRVSHNMFVNTLIEGGLLGLFLLLAAFAQAFITAYKRKNMLGVLVLAGFFAEGMSLDAVYLRLFGVAFVCCSIFGSKQIAAKQLEQAKILCTKRGLGGEKGLKQ